MLRPNLWNIDKICVLQQKDFAFYWLTHIMKQKRSDSLVLNKAEPNAVPGGEGFHFC